MSFLENLRHLKDLQYLNLAINNITKAIPIYKIFLLLFRKIELLKVNFHFMLI